MINHNPTPLHLSPHRLGVLLVLVVLGVVLGGCAGRFGVEAGDAPLAEMATTPTGPTDPATTEPANSDEGDTPNQGGAERGDGLCAGGVCLSEEDAAVSGAQVKAVVDGDTLAVSLEAGGEARVRLIGVNAAEGGECWSGEATAALEEAVNGAFVELWQMQGNEEDQYGRMLAFVVAGGEMVNLGLVEAGAVDAVAYQGHPFVTVFDAAAKEAKAAGRGRWSSACVAASGELSVVAVEYNPTGSDVDGEWVLLEAHQRVELDGYVLADSSSSHRYRFPSLTLEAGERVRIHTGCSVGANAVSESVIEGQREVSLWWCAGGAVWNNDGDRVSVRNRDGVEITAYEYQG